MNQVIRDASRGPSERLSKVNRDQYKNIKDSKNIVNE